jgi:hypothetical protein
MYECTTGGGTRRQLSRNSARFVVPIGSMMPERMRRPMLGSSASPRTAGHEELGERADNESDDEHDCDVHVGS